MSEFEKVNDVPATSAEPFDHQTILTKNENIKRSFGEVAKEKLDNLADDDHDNPGRFLGERATGMCQRV